MSRISACQNAVILQLPNVFFLYLFFSKSKMEDFFFNNISVFSKQNASPLHMESVYCGLGNLKKWLWGCQIQQSLFGLWRCTTVQRLSYMVFNRVMDITGKDFSHLCHHKLCVCVKHLSAEPHTVNNARQKCVKSCCCSGHEEFPNCVLYLKF